ncbi:MAG: glycosyltransferase family 39 protein [Planctomycetota bacterium]|nr:MAG: glycosyltransferase family 39 protein [Planctomycetota bacterium]
MTHRPLKWLRITHWPHRYIIPILLVLSAIFAFGSLLGDSITYDETSHLTAGMSYLVTGDFRLEPDHPPLAEMWAALPLLLTNQQWPPPEIPGWRQGDMWQVGRAWLYDFNDGEKLMTIARCMMLPMLIATCACIYIIGRRLFGPAAGLIALILAVFSPTLLAHGRLVAADLPATLFMMLSLIAFARLMDRITWAGLLSTSLALAALSLTKFSWPLIIPALLIMAAVAAIRTRPIEFALFRLRSKKENQGTGLIHRGHRVVTLFAVGIFFLVVVWGSIWTCFGWRYSPFRGPDRDRALMIDRADLGWPAPKTMQEVWQTVLYDHSGKPIKGAVPAFVSWARKYHLLPEAYIYGLAFTNKATSVRSAYLMGEISNTGFRSYFPIAFAIKTPLAIILLLLAGLAAVITRKTNRGSAPVLMAGLVVFTFIYALFAITSHINIGHRHILPIYPALMIFAGASAAWLNTRTGRWFVAASIAWLIIANIWIHPHYLSYFNELIGGPKNGHHYLADSNIDWGQDLKRLARYDRQHHDQNIKLAYFGSGNPSRYGFKCEMLPSSFDFGEPAELTAGTYVISVTQLLGVYYPIARDSFWKSPTNIKSYNLLTQMLARPVPEDQSDQAREKRLKMIKQYDIVSRGRLINQFRHRTPDLRIGYSLFVYRLDQTDIETILKP